MINIYEEGDKVYYINYDDKTNVVEVKSGIISNVIVPGNVELTEIEYSVNVGDVYAATKTLDVYSVFGSKDHAMQQVRNDLKILSLQLAIAELKELKKEQEQLYSKMTAYSLYMDDYYKKKRWI